MPRAAVRQPQTITPRIDETLQAPAAKPPLKRSNNKAFEPSEAYIARARECLRLAKEATLPQRCRIQMQAAARWIQLAERTRQIERKAIDRLAAATAQPAVETYR